MPSQSVKDVYTRRIKLVLLKNSPAEAQKVAQHVAKAGENLHEYYASICKRYGETPQKPFELSEKKVIKQDAIQEMGGTHLPTNHLPIKSKMKPQKEKRDPPRIVEVPRPSKRSRTRNHSVTTEQGLIRELFDILPTSYASYKDLFLHHGCDNDIILSLTLSDLPSLGVTNPVHAKRIGNALRSIQEVFKPEDPAAMMDFLVDHGLGLLAGPLTRLHLTSPELLMECDENDFLRIGKDLPLALVLRLKAAIRNTKEQNKPKSDHARLRRDIKRLQEEIQRLQSDLKRTNFRVADLERAQERPRSSLVRVKSTPSSDRPRFDSIIIDHKESTRDMSMFIDRERAIDSEEKEPSGADSVSKRSKFDLIKEKQKRRQEATRRRKRNRSSLSGSLTQQLSNFARVHATAPTPLEPVPSLDEEPAPAAIIKSKETEKVLNQKSEEPKVGSENQLTPLSPVSISSSTSDAATPERKFKKSSSLRSLSSPKASLSPEEKARRKKAKDRFDKTMDQLRKSYKAPTVCDKEHKISLIQDCENITFKIKAITSSVDGKHMYVAGHSSILVYDETGALLGNISFEKEIVDIAMTPDEATLFVAGKTSLYIISNPLKQAVNADNAKMKSISIKKFSGKIKTINGLLMHGKYIFVANRGTKYILAYDVNGKNNTPSKKYKHDNVGPMCAASGYIFASDGRGRTKMFDIDVETDVKTFRDNLPAQRCYVVADGLFLFTLNSSGHLIEWDVQKGSRLREFEKAYNDFIVSPHELSTLVLLTDRKLHCLNLGTGEVKDKDEELIGDVNATNLRWIDEDDGKFVLWSLRGGLLQLHQVEHI